MLQLPERPRLTLLRLALSRHTVTCCSYLKDVKVGQGLSMAQALAAQLGPQLQGQRSFREADLADLVKKVPVKLGGGKVTMALADVVPAGCMRDFERACEGYARDL